MSKPLGPYSPVVRAGDFVIVSGQGGMADGKIVGGGVSAETTQTMKNVAAQLATVGASLTDVVKTTCFLTDMENFTAFNEAYAAALGNHRPARSTVAVAGLPAGFLDRQGEVYSVGMLDHHLRLEPSEAGERITQAALTALFEARDMGVRIAFVADPTLKTLKVLPASV